MPAPITIHLIRHGEVHNPEGIYYGRLPGFHLSENGRQQARCAGKALADQPIAGIYASPMERAQETANLISELIGLNETVIVDARLNEVHTPYDGTLHAELELTNHDLYAGNTAPYERPRDVRRRLIEFLNEMRSKHANQTVIGVTHGDLVVSAFMFAHHQDENDIGRSRTQPNRIHSLGLPEIYPATASISTLKYTSSDPLEVPEYGYLRPYAG